MADDTLLLDMSLLSGINTVDAETDLNPERTDQGEMVFPLRAAQNVIINNQRKPETRIGYNKVMDGISTHSLWSNGDVCLFVEEDKLMMLNDDMSLTQIRHGLIVGARMTYKQWGSRIYYSNKYQIGWIDTEFSDHNIRMVDQDESAGSEPIEQIWEYPNVATISMSGDANG